MSLSVEQYVARWRETCCPVLRNMSLGGVQYGLRPCKITTFINSHQIFGQKILSARHKKSRWTGKTSPPQGIKLFQWL